MQKRSASPAGIPAWAQRIPGTALLIKLAKEREKERQKKELAKAERAAVVDLGAVDEAMAEILRDLE